MEMDTELDEETIMRIIKEERERAVARYEADAEAALGPMDTDQMLSLEEEIRAEHAA
ncbi:hypothetical protein MCUN1_001663 [Malassezia cuniculi]|uniref:Uncharacterized protein n=1 Tax=Malassezia cuniculi TaxID=948313 RepID=A0AAF0EUJ0_9BASI|nr:hypothetical protein MCUN1_001663 [Malassezia cuniculi]